MPGPANRQGHKLVPKWSPEPLKGVNEVGYNGGMPEQAGIQNDTGYAFRFTPQLVAQSEGMDRAIRILDAPIVAAQRR